MPAQYELTFPLVPRRRLLGLAFGSVRSARRGMGSDVASSRPYRPGDDVDTIDWNASAKLSSARGTDEFVVRERFAEEAPRVVILCDRRPEMELYPPGLPWLSKPTVLVEAGRQIADSAAKARGLVGYLDYASGDEEPFWRPPHSQQDFWRVKESHLVWPEFRAPRDNLTRAFIHLVAARRSLPPGSFVFILSDFLASPPPEVWEATLEHPWEVVPVVIQDPTWEQSFPRVSSVVVPIADPGTGRLQAIRLSRREADRRRAENEARLERLLGDLRNLGLDPLLLATTDRNEIYSRFLTWSDLRRYGAGGPW
jgi:uncharacterized protein (DUF58 family)